MLINSDDVAQNDGSDGKPIWMSYGGVVYDVTNFIHNHPGGSERILLAAGSVCFNYLFLFINHHLFRRIIIIYLHLFFHFKHTGY